MFVATAATAHARSFVRETETHLFTILPVEYGEIWIYIINKATLEIAKAKSTIAWPLLKIQNSVLLLKREDSIELNNTKK